MTTSLLRAAVMPVALGLLFPAAPAPAGAQDQDDNWQAPAEAKLLQNPLRNDGGTVARGQKLFQRYCVPCHGAAGAADGKMAQTLGYKPANLTLEQMSQLSDGEIFWKISKGRKPMPIFEQQLSQRERWDLVSYVRTLMKVTQ